MINSNDIGKLIIRMTLRCYTTVYWCSSSGWTLVQLCTRGRFSTQLNFTVISKALIAQLGERQTEDLEVSSSILLQGILVVIFRDVYGVQVVWLSGMDDTLYFGRHFRDIAQHSYIITPIWFLLHTEIVPQSCASTKTRCFESLDSSVGRAPD